MRRWCAVCCLIVSACGSTDWTAQGEFVQVVLVDSAPAPPSVVEGRCVVFTRVLTATEAANYTNEPAKGVFHHIGSSVLSCMQGKASEYMNAHPEAFFSEMLDIVLDGSCPPATTGCYYPMPPTIDLAQVQAAPRPEGYESTLLGHEIWHAVAGSFHP